MGAVKQMNTNEKGICFAREIKFISRLQGKALALPRVLWASEERTHLNEERVGKKWSAVGGVNFVAVSLGQLQPLKLCFLLLFVE